VRRAISLVYYIYIYRPTLGGGSRRDDWTPGLGWLVGWLVVSLARPASDCSVCDPIDVVSTSLELRSVNCMKDRRWIGAEDQRRNTSFRWTRDLLSVNNIRTVQWSMLVSYLAPLSVVDEAIANVWVRTEWGGAYRAIDLEKTHPTVGRTTQVDQLLHMYVCGALQVDRFEWEQAAVHRLRLTFSESIWWRWETGAAVVKEVDWNKLIDYSALRFPLRRVAEGCVLEDWRQASKRWMSTWHEHWVATSAR